MSGTAKKGKGKDSADYQKRRDEQHQNPKVHGLHGLVTLRHGARKAHRAPLGMGVGRDSAENHREQDFTQAGHIFYLGVS